MSDCLTCGHPICYHFPGLCSVKNCQCLAYRKPSKSAPDAGQRDESSFFWNEPPRLNMFSEPVRICCRKDAMCANHKAAMPKPASPSALVERIVAKNRFPTCISVNGEVVNNAIRAALLEYEEERKK